MSLFKKLILCSALVALSFVSHAEQKTTFGKWDIHHIAFPSTFIQPQTAKAVNVTRRGDLALINISIINNQTGKPSKAKVSGVAKNLLGHIKELSFVEVDEGNAIYYIAEVKHRNEETLRFNIDVLPSDGKSYSVEFKNKFYVD